MMRRQIECNVVASYRVSQSRSNWHSSWRDPDQRVEVAKLQRVRLAAPLGGRGDFQEWRKAMQAPFEVLDIPDAAARNISGYDLLLLRPDVQIAWHGSRAPQSWETVARVVTRRRPGERDR